MSEPIERYYPDYYGDMRYSKYGDWVEYADYEKLEAENTRLKAEVERLRKAGDAMYQFFLWVEKNKSEEVEKTMDEWEAAKEGNQP